METFRTLAWPTGITQFRFTPKGQPEHVIFWDHSPQCGSVATVGKRADVAAEDDTITWERVALPPSVQAMLDALLPAIYERNRHAARLLMDIRDGEVADIDTIKARAEPADWQMLTGRDKSPAAIRAEAHAAK